MSQLPLFGANPPARTGGSSLQEIVAYTDGGARGNPGRAGYRVRIERPDGTRHGRASSLAREVGRVTYEHGGRSSNAPADRLANAAMDAAGT